MNDIRYWSRRWALGVRICYLGNRIRKYNLNMEVSALKIIGYNNKIINITRQIKENERLIQHIRSL